MDEPKKDEETFDQEFLEKLIVGIGEVSLITGIPTRKIRYWEQKGAIDSLTEEEGRNRRYDYRNVKKMLLIKELLDEGFTFEAASRKVEKRLDTITKTLTALGKRHLKNNRSN